MSLAGRRRVWLSLSLLLVLHSSGSGQTPDRPAQTPGSELEIYLMTMGVGSEIWERFGHNAIGVRDLARGTDVVYNYGTFDFAAPGFVTNFLQGRMTYWLDSADAEATVRWYRERRRRSVYIQDLNLLPAQRVELKTFLEWNVREENKFYRYDYYRDNCSTRIRDVLDSLLAGRFRSLTDTIFSGSTYRSHTRRLTTNNPLMYTAIETGMGQVVDRPISAWEEMFLPLALQEHIRGVTVTGADGVPVPLIRAEHVIYESDAHSFEAEPPSWLPWYLLLGLVLGGTAVVLARRGALGGPARTVFILLAALWYLVMGLGGLILLGLWGFTDHLVTRQNENVLQLSLLALPLVVLFPLGLARGGNWMRSSLRTAALVTILSCLGLVLKLFPWFDQINLEIIALTLPVYLGITAGLVILAREQPVTERVQA